MGAHVTPKAPHLATKRCASIHGAAVLKRHSTEAFMKGGILILELAVTHVDDPRAAILFRVRKFLHLLLQRVDLVFGALPDGSLRLAIIGTFALQLGSGEPVN
jgi:hypothetical protein